MNDAKGMNKKYDIAIHDRLYVFHCALHHYESETSTTDSFLYTSSSSSSRTSKSHESDSER